MKNQNFHIVVENLYNTICSVYPKFSTLKEKFPVNDYVTPITYETVTSKELFDKLMVEDFEFDAPRINNISRFGVMCGNFLIVKHSDDEKLNLARCLYYAYLYQSDIVKRNAKCGMI